MSGIADLSAFELAAAFAHGDVTARAAVDAVAARIDRLQGRLNAYASTDIAGARERADDLDRRRARGEALGRLAGVVLSIKDNFATSSGATACGSRMLAGYHAPYNATVVARILAEDGIIIGKTAMDEFAMGSTTETSASGPVRNPWDPARVPGGSSGGAACAVAARLCHGGYGSDTGGSIRLPAAFCGVTGLKPTYGRVSRYGLVAYGSSLDQIGPLARDARDAALLLSAVEGHDPRDSTSAPLPPRNYLAALGELPRELRIGVARASFEGGCEGAVLASVDAACAAYRGLGATIVPIEMPMLKYAVACYYIVATAEASSNLARYDGVHFGHRTAEKEPPGENATVFLYSSSRREAFGAEVKRRIMLGTHVLSSGYYDAYYLKALKVRRLIKEEFDRVFERCDLVLLPASPTAPFALGEKITDPLAMYLSDVFTVSANLAGIPALSLPAGFAGGLPLGVQLLAPPLGEELLLQAGHAFQQATDWHRRTPPAGEEGA
ncbi:MAG TPA: Asp-tRNA(Asn)/Glu-tRNA(Gln) amidotransferase GatCAB subunit A [Planctomycetes bacterium]|nr:Asp-tRNA(Asn)/Glu-tRNA(Gln) amidotransferase GatCAB subunit A [Planctomycetota bacterium]